MFMDKIDDTDGNPPTRLATLVRGRMKELGITQAELAAAAGTKQQSVSALLSGDVATPRRWREIAKALDLPETEFRRLMIEARRVTGKTTRIPKSVRDAIRAVSPSAALPIQEWRGPALPVYGQAVGGEDGVYEFNGETHAYTARPPVLDGVSSAYAVYVDGDSMSPRYMPGELVYVNPSRPAKFGEDVIVQVRNEGDDAELPPRGYIKRFDRYAGNKLVLSQYNPVGEIFFDRDSVVSVHPIVGRLS